MPLQPQLLEVGVCCDAVPQELPVHTILLEPAGTHGTNGALVARNNFRSDLTCPPFEECLRQRGADGVFSQAMSPQGFFADHIHDFIRPRLAKGGESDKAYGAAFFQTHQEEMPGAVKMVCQHRSRHIHGQLPQGETDVGGLR